MHPKKMSMLQEWVVDSDDNQVEDGGYTCDRNSGLCRQTSTGQSESYASCQQRCFSYNAPGQLRRIREGITELEQYGFQITFLLETTVQKKNQTRDPAIIANLTKGTDVYAVYAVGTNDPIIKKNDEQLVFNVSMIQSILGVTKPQAPVRARESVYLQDKRAEPKAPPVLNREETYLQDKKMTRKRLLTLAWEYGTRLPSGYKSRPQLCRLVADHENDIVT
jgi:hypothetical protein